jgi:predicted protein tyrosine phosphatase
MTVPNITIASWYEADQILRANHRFRMNHVLSIGDRGEPWPNNLRDTNLNILRLEFADIGIPWNKPLLHDRRPPSMGDMQAVLTWARKIPAGANVLVHCHAGISRSSASAYSILCQALGPGKEKEAVRQLLKIKKNIMPNGMMVLYADRLLKRDNDMLLALAGKLPMAPEVLQAAGCALEG